MKKRELSHDALWPRSGNWPPPSVFDAQQRFDLSLIGIPTWRTSLSATGTAATPAAVREALRYYSAFRVPDRQTADVSGLRLAAAPSPAPSPSAPSRPYGRAMSELLIVDYGDVHEPDGEEGEARATAAMALASARSDVVVALGGDNALTVPAALGAFGDELSTAGLITLDAHHDLRDGITNGAPVRRLAEAGVAGQRIVQIGIADFANSAEYFDRAMDLGITVVHRDELHSRPMADVMAEALEIAGAAGGPIHVDLDVDVCDRSVAPGCPASIPGGISAWELRCAARAAGRHAQVRSIDLAEVDPTADAPDQRTVRLTALCVLEVVAGLALRN